MKRELQGIQSPSYVRSLLRRAMVSKRWGILGLVTCIFYFRPMIQSQSGRNERKRMERRGYNELVTAQPLVLRADACSLSLPSGIATRDLNVDRRGFPGLFDVRNAVTFATTWRPFVYHPLLVVVNTIVTEPAIAFLQRLPRSASKRVMESQYV